MTPRTLAYENTQAPPTPSSLNPRTSRRTVTCRRLAPLALGSLLLGSCLERPIGSQQPVTTNVLTDNLVNNAVDKIDLLFVIDNSLSMADKQKLLGRAVPDLVDGLLQPTCVNREGQPVGRVDRGTCPEGAVPEFQPVDDIHVGVITSSLGGYGASVECTASALPNSEQGVDMAHLLGSLPRGAAVAPTAVEGGFSSWTKDSDHDQFIGELRGLVTHAGERGCAWEAPLEAWLRFLVDPYPHTKIVRQPCSASDDAQRCVGPETNAAGEQLIDTTLLEQRRRFLRPDSLLAIIMLSDENDCSFLPSGQTWLLSQTRTEESSYIPAIRSSAACETEGPNSVCCQSCGQTSVATGCATSTNEDGETVPVGCEAGRRYAGTDEDPPNLRCFEQKRRFGVDMLYPVERYSNALTLKQLCPFADDLSPDSELCAGGAGLVENPLFADLSTTADGTVGPAHPPRPDNLVFFAGIVGVPWQDIAVSTDPDAPLVYRTNQLAPDEESGESSIDWSWIVGERHATQGLLDPIDPLMHESRQPRTGTNIATGETLAPTDSTAEANSINGHEWNAHGAGDLQYACVFPLESAQDCPTPTELALLSEEEQQEVPYCDCTDIGSDEFKSPLCQAPDGSYGRRQYRAKAYPSLRQLRALHDFGENSIVASICPKTTDPAAADYGYRPAMAAIVERLKSQLGDKCYQRQLATQTDGSTSCIIVEATRPVEGSSRGCSALARGEVGADVADSVREHLLASRHCSNAAECAAFELCEIEQILPDVDPDGLASCRNDPAPSGDGWCYIDEQLHLGNPQLVQNCPATARRKVRFAGAGQPAPNSVTTVFCAGATFHDEETSPASESARSN